MYILNLWPYVHTHTHTEKKRQSDSLQVGEIELPSAASQMDAVARVGPSQSQQPGILPRSVGSRGQVLCHLLLVA